MTFFIIVDTTEVQLTTEGLSAAPGDGGTSSIAEGFNTIELPDIIAYFDDPLAECTV